MNFAPCTRRSVVGVAGAAGHRASPLTGTAWPTDGHMLAATDGGSMVRIAALPTCTQACAAPPACMRRATPDAYMCTAHFCLARTRTCPRAAQECGDFKRGACFRATCKFLHGGKPASEVALLTYVGLGSTRLLPRTPTSAASEAVRREGHVFLPDRHLSLSLSI